MSEEDGSCCGGEIRTRQVNLPIVLPAEERMEVTVRPCPLERDMRQGQQAASPAPAEVATKWGVALAKRPLRTHYRLTQTPSWEGNDRWAVDSETLNILLKGQ